MTTTVSTETFLDRVEAARVRAADLDQKHDERSGRSLYRSSLRRSTTELDAIPKPMKGTENFSFVLVRGRHDSVLTKELKSIDPTSSGIWLKGNYNCVILYRGNLLMDVNGKPYIVQGGKADGLRVCESLEANGMNPGSYLEQTREQEERHKAYRAEAAMKERMEAFAILKAARLLQTCAVVNCPDGEVPQGIVTKLVEKAEHELKRIFMRQGLLPWEYDEKKVELPEEWRA